jgi:hypothetical protein
MKSNAGKFRCLLDGYPDPWGFCSHLILYWRENGTQVPESLLKDSEGSLEETRRREVGRFGIG